MVDGSQRLRTIEQFVLGGFRLGELDGLPLLSGFTFEDLPESRQRHPFVAKAFADSAYNAARVSDATSIDMKIVRKIAGQIGFTVHPRRWVVERTFA